MVVAGLLDNFTCHNEPSNVGLMMLNAPRRGKSLPMSVLTLRFVTYFRVSTERQGRSGLGLEAQREAVSRYISTSGGEVVAEYQEVESGKRGDRPQLAAALAECRARRATLLIAKLDRLSRNARFLLGVVEGTGDAGVVFCDLPSIQPGPMGKYIVTNMAAIAELEGGLISQRTRAALSAARARGTKLGNPALRAGSAEMAKAAAAARSELAKKRAAFVIPYIDQARRAGAVTLKEIATALAARGIHTATGSMQWHPMQVARIERYRLNNTDAAGQLSRNTEI